MANITKGYGIADTVWVAYPFPSANTYIAQSRVVKDIGSYEADNDCLVSFTNGESVFDGAGALQAVFTTQALASKQVVDNVIIAVDAAVNLDTTTTVGSTAAQTALSLGRVDA